MIVILEPLVLLHSDLSSPSRIQDLQEPLQVASQGPLLQRSLLVLNPIHHFPPRGQPPRITPGRPPLQSYQNPRQNRSL